MKTMLALAREWLAAEQQRLEASGETVHTGHPAHIVEWLLEEVRLRTLTDEEREAIREACDEGRWYPRDYSHIHTLRGLLERTDARKEA